MKFKLGFPVFLVFAMHSNGTFFHRYDIQIVSASCGRKQIDSDVLG